jgi:L-serine dehydratase
MECISVFDMLKIGIGPSSSHTLGPWRAAERFVRELKTRGKFDQVIAIRVLVYGSLSLTGKGHATDLAILMGLSGADPERVPIEEVPETVARIRSTSTLALGGSRAIPFREAEHLVFLRKFLPFHANALTFEASCGEGRLIRETYYSIGGGFVVTKRQENAKRKERYSSPSHSRYKAGWNF